VSRSNRSARLPGLLATYLIGFFSLSLLQMVAIVTPLWGNHLGLSVAMIGFAAGCRSILPLIYSIHFGSVIDIVGVRRVSIFFSALCAILPLLYPLLPYSAAFALLQLFLGLGSAMVWLAAQTAIARGAPGDYGKTGWFSFFSTAGTVMGPAILGFSWSAGGPGMGFGLIALWSACLLILSLVMPARRDIVRPRLRVAHFIPRLESYTEGWSMLRRPVVGFVIALAFVRLGGVSMLESFYPLLLQDFGFSAATIGLLIAIGNLVSSPSSLLVNGWVRLCRSPLFALVVSAMLTVIGVMVTPLLREFWQLAIAVACFGFGVGVSMPLMFSLLSQGVEANQQGLVVGIRASANRLAAFILPVVMGLVAELAGIGPSFWIVGLALIALGWTAHLVFRSRV